MNITAFLAGTASYLLIGSAAAQNTCPRDGENGPAALHASWILEGWERKPGDPTFVFADKLGRYYDLNAPAVLYDDLAPNFETARDAARYGAIWEGPFNGMRSARHAISDGPDAIVGDTVASTTLEFVALLENAEGKVTAIRDRSQIGWECDGERWVIRHENNNGREVPRDEVEQHF